MPADVMEKQSSQGSGFTPNKRSRWLCWIYPSSYSRYARLPHSARRSNLDLESSRSRRSLSRVLVFLDWLFGSIIFTKRFFLLFAVTITALSLFTSVPFVPHFIRIGTPQVVIILAANRGGGVNNWKGPNEWMVERMSIANKRAYAKRHGYQLAIKDVSEKKRYAHEWRESWEKADIIKQTMRQYPKAKWFWWLDLHTFIMEPQMSLESHIFNQIDKIAYRNLTEYNPLNIPVSLDYVENDHEVGLLLGQDCGGFNLGSFIIRRSDWSDRLLDVWWDPIFYEQMHMYWDHKEQDALETLYTNQAWLRSGVAFLPLRTINSFPPGACSESNGDTRIFYNEHDRDFLVNMAGCEWGRDCLNEMNYYRKLSKQLHAKKFLIF